MIKYNKINMKLSLEKRACTLDASEIKHINGN